MNKNDFDVITACPFCGLMIKVVPGGDVPHVKHTLPPCKTFVDAKDALDFVEKCNDKLGIVRA